MKGPIRVLELRSVFGTGGGPEKTILLGAARADRSRYRVTVCYLRHAQDAVFGIHRRAEKLGVDYVEIRERGALDPSIWTALCRLVRERDIQLIHAHEYKTNLLALLLARATGAVPLTTVHGWTGHSAIEKRLYYPADKLLIGRFPMAIAVSSEIRDELVRWRCNPARVTVVLNGIDHRRFYHDPGKRAHARAALGCDARDVMIGSVGRLEPQKRFDLLIEAFARIHRIHPNARLVIAGEGTCRPDLDAQIRTSGLTDVCKLLGQTSDIVGFHHALDLFVQSSAYEGTPNVVLEAMALETPIIATDVGGTAELVRDGVDGLIIPPLSVDQLERAIIDALERPAKTSARRASARRRVEHELSFDSRMDTVEAIYDRLVADTCGAQDAGNMLRLPQ